MEIRRVTLRDLDKISEIERICFPPAEAAGRPSLKRRLEIFSAHFLLGEEDGKAVGYIGGMATERETIIDEMFDCPEMHREDGAWQSIFSLAVLPEYQKRGHAAGLMEAFIKQAEEEGRKGCILTCKEKLVRYYEKFGYENRGVSASVHGGAVWYDMTLSFS